MDDACSLPSLVKGPTGVWVVGLGASAGGLDPLVRILSNVPTASGLAYLVVQHMDPTHKTMLGELLQRATLMPVHEAVDAQPIKANSVHVIPPNSELTVVGGALHLAKPAEPRGQRLPIDVMLSSLARELGDPNVTMDHRLLTAQREQAMIYKFKCKAAGDVLMAGPVGDRLLGIVGKPVSAQGILQPSDMLSAIRALELAVAEDESRLADDKSRSTAADEAAEEADEVTLRQHAWPLIEMMKQAQVADEVIVWGV